MRLWIIGLSLMLAACRHEPPLPPDLPRPDDELMQVLPPLPLLPETRPASMEQLYKHSAVSLGQCMVDRRRYADLQKYVRGLTK